MEKLISKKQVRELVSISSTQIDRWENDIEYAHLGFPRRYRIGERVFWSYEEIQDFIARMKAKRDTPK
jgi:predicted DNA-binding transcriptional regulator AlpA